MDYQIDVLPSQVKIDLVVVEVPATKFETTFSMESKKVFLDVRKRLRNNYSCQNLFQQINSYSNTIPTT